MAQYRDAHRDPALVAEHRGHVAYDEQDAGHLVMPDGSLVSSGDRAFLTAAAPYVLAAHMAVLRPCSNGASGSSRTGDPALAPSGDRATSVQRASLCTATCSCGGAA